MQERGAKALFLDRDGIINVDHGYVYEIDKFEFTEGLFELLRIFVAKGYLLFVVTNQSGIERGYYSEDDFQTLTKWMLDRLKKEGIEVTSVQFCPHEPQKKCTCRKPKRGMVDKILSQHRIDLANSWLIGDKQSDIDLALNSDIANTIGIGKRTIEKATHTFKTILECKLFLEENQAIIKS
ncbi:MAG: D-glycero-D-manno-heptose 1,7-bisphosphate phosphatase (EC [uncultured Sulfurovum sp.]|uniref:D,D-heptose 1,7-bisphosphate phosphatase n=1 Tax=uncultured Sulfurovum sp. TaxID=269237 RepID=A0A6S6TEJ2_9BACT|nr:MAG: D-glycero-D-manno-heptose 1,7-bisphosphate phosphatase (EC [uncultured Sulfurovum sp.]